MSGYAIKIAVVSGVATAATFGAISLFIKEAAFLSEVAPKDAPGALQPEAQQKSPLQEPSLEVFETRPNASVESSATETLLDPWKTASEIEPSGTMAVKQPELTAEIVVPGLGRNDSLLQETKDISSNIKSSKTEIVDNLSSRRVNIRKESVNTIFNTGIRNSFSKLYDKKFKFDVLSGNLNLEHRNGFKQSKAMAKTVNLYQVGAALGAETYICIAAAKLDCAKAGQTREGCEHPQKAVLHNCVDKAMDSADALISNQLIQDAG